MARTIYIVPEGADPVAALPAAQAAGAGEVAVGIPPALVGKIKAADLPTAYTEPEPPEPEPTPEPEPDPIATLRSDLDWLINYVVTGEG